MKSLMPLVLPVGMFAAGCATSEDNFMAGTPPSARPIASIASAAAPQKPLPVETNTITIAPALTLPSDPEPATTKAAAAPAARLTPVLPIIITPDNSLAGKVLAYNSSGHFVVLEFPAGPMPTTDQSLFLYRAGLKVAEVKITGPQRDNDTVADLVNGDAQTGDEVRDQ
jgi:hypothetical protein